MTPTIGLVALPDQLLVAVSEYLIVPSRLLLSVALTAPTSSPQWRRGDLTSSHLSAATRDLLMEGDTGESNNAVRWERIDFGVIYPLQLSGDDVFAVLSCIKSTGHIIKRFGLGELKIDCNGVEPLRGCKTLEQFDLGNSCDTDRSMAFLPILESIIDTDGNSLKHIWGKMRAPGRYPLVQRQRLKHFSERYEQVLLNRNPLCSRCSKRHEHVSVDWDLGELPENSGITVSQPWTCVECLGHSCGLRFHTFCNHCEKCSNCVTGRIGGDEVWIDDWDGTEFCEECVIDLTENGKYNIREFIENWA